MSLEMPDFSEAFQSEKTGSTPVGSANRFNGLSRQLPPSPNHLQAICKHSETVRSIPSLPQATPRVLGARAHGREVEQNVPLVTPLNGSRWESSGALQAKPNED